MVRGKRVSPASGLALALAFAVACGRTMLDTTEDAATNASTGGSGTAGGGGVPTTSGGVDPMGGKLNTAGGAGEAMQASGGGASGDGGVSGSGGGDGGAPFKSCGGVDEPTGDLWVPEDAPTIQQAIDSVTDSAVIVVCPGTYVENLNFNGKTIELLSAAGPAVTTIDGGGIDAVIKLVSWEPAGTIRDFTIRNGRNDNGAGIATLGASPTIEGNVFDDNEQEDGGFGAAIGGNNSSAIVSGNVFVRNDCDGQWLSGVISFINGSAPRIVNNVFADNTCRGISLNVALAPEVSNNTIIGGPEGVYILSGILSQTVFRNNIILNAQVGVKVALPPVDLAAAWTHNLLFGNGSNYAGMTDRTGLEGNLSVDPQLVDPATGDFHLQPGSPAIDSGTDALTALTATDHDGDSRLLDGNDDDVLLVDIGADEFVPSP